MLRDGHAKDPIGEDRAHLFEFSSRCSRMRSLSQALVTKYAARQGRLPSLRWRERTLAMSDSFFRPSISCRQFSTFSTRSKGR